MMYAFTLLNYVLYCISRFQRNKIHMLLLNILANTSMLLGLWCAGSLTGSYSTMLSVALLIMAFVKEKYGGKNNNSISCVLYMIFLLVYVYLFMATYEGISSILIICSSLLTLTGVWWLNPQNMRMIGIFASLLFLLYMMSIRNWMGLLETCVIVANIISWIKYRDSKEET